MQNVAYRPQFEVGVPRGECGRHLVRQAGGDGLGELDAGAEGRVDDDLPPHHVGWLPGVFPFVFQQMWRLGGGDLPG
ncbi:MAG TPA: hypothetical protein VE645_18715 [Pseudonocardiaceae bacterium]|nr:hypothetical protein [Pseudonocardiaceae bacterium]